jgi:L-serine kinase (ADP)
MTQPPEFELVPIERLRAHEQIDESDLPELIASIARSGVFAHPIWVARGSFVILNGHHRVEALRRMGAARVPAWLLDYDSDLVSLEPWRPGPAISKTEVVRRALHGELFPPKSTRHAIRAELPAHPTPLAEIVPRPAGDRYEGPSASPRPRGSGRSDAR